MSWEWGWRLKAAGSTMPQCDASGAAPAQGHLHCCCSPSPARMLRMKEMITSGQPGGVERGACPAGSRALAPLPHSGGPSPALSPSALSLQGAIKA